MTKPVRAVIRRSIHSLTQPLTKQFTGDTHQINQLTGSTRQSIGTCTPSVKKQFTGVRNSASVLADVQVTSPQNLFIFLMKKVLPLWVKVSKHNTYDFIYETNNNTRPHKAERRAYSIYHPMCTHHLRGLRVHRAFLRWDIHPWA